MTAPDHKTLFTAHNIDKAFGPVRALENVDFELRPGLVIAVEPMVNMGTKRVRMQRDYWTQSTADGQPSAHFEHTIAFTPSGPRVLTAGPD